MGSALSSLLLELGSRRSLSGLAVAAFAQKPSFLEKDSHHTDWRILVAVKM